MLLLIGVFNFLVLLWSVQSLILHCLEALFEVDNFLNSFFLICTLM